MLFRSREKDVEGNEGAVRADDCVRRRGGDLPGGRRVGGGARYVLAGLGGYKIINSSIYSSILSILDHLSPHFQDISCILFPHKNSLYIFSLMSLLHGAGTMS